MRTTHDTIAVRAGKPVEFVFENSDLMPHNFVIAKRGSLEEIGHDGRRHGPAARRRRAALRAAVGQDPAGEHAAAAAILGKAELRRAHRAGRLSLRLHVSWPLAADVRRLYVVEDLDAYLENPESYLAAHPLEIKDTLLKDRRPRTEWKLDDLAGAVARA